jgi:hypothetical protein
MRTEMPLSKPIRLLISQTENLLDTEISLLRNPEADPNGTLIDIFTYTVEKNIILIPAHYTGLLKDFIIARHCTHLLIKGAAAKKSRYLSVPSPEIPCTREFTRSISTLSRTRQKRRKNSRS